MSLGPSWADARDSTTMVMDTTSDVMVIVPDSIVDTSSRAVSESPLKSHQCLPASTPGNPRGVKTSAYARPHNIAHIAAGISHRLARKRVRRFMKYCMLAL